MATALPYITAASMVVGAGSSIYYSEKGRTASKKAVKEQKAATAKAIAEAKAEKERIANLASERLERLRKRGAILPPSLLTTGSMSGAQAAPAIKRPILG